MTIDVVIRPGDSFTAPGIDPAHLYADDGGLSTQGPGWGLYLAIAAMLLLAAALTVGPRPGRAGGRAPAGPPGPASA